MKLIVYPIFLMISFGISCQEMQLISNCDSLLTTAKNKGGCGTGYIQRRKLMFKSADCFEENNEIDKAIQLAESQFYDVDEQRIGSHGWIEKWVHFLKIKFGNNYVHEQLNGMFVKIEVDTFYLEIAKETVFGEGFNWEEIISVGVNAFGKNIGIGSTIESAKMDEEICRDFISEKIPIKQMKDYFDKRWKDSILYNEIAKIE